MDMVGQASCCIALRHIASVVWIISNGDAAIPYDRVLKLIVHARVFVFFDKPPNLPSAATHLCALEIGMRLIEGDFWIYYCFCFYSGHYCTQVQTPVR